MTYWKYIYSEDSYAIWERDEEKFWERCIYHYKADLIDPDPTDWAAWDCQDIKNEIKKNPTVFDIIVITKDEAFLEMI